LQTRRLTEFSAFPITETAFLTPFLPIHEVAWQTFSTGMFFGNCPQNFHTFTGHIWKATKVQKFALPSSEMRVSTRVSLALVAEQTSACRFAYTLPLCNLQGLKVLNLTFFPIMLYSMRFMMHTKTKPNNGLNGAAFWW